MKARHYFSISIFLILFLVIPHSALSQTPDGDVAPLGARDGTVNVGDALVALRFALGLESPTPDDSIHVDVAPLDADNKPNPDGVITVGDALVILRKALGLVYFNGGTSTAVPGGDCDTAMNIDINGSYSGNLKTDVEYHYFKVVLTSGGTLTIHTTGDTDVAGAIFDNSCTIIEEDDDSGEQLNFYIRKTLSAGTYYIAVTSADYGVTGPYTLHLAFEASGTGQTTKVLSGTITLPDSSPVSISEVKVEVLVDNVTPASSGGFTTEVPADAMVDATIMLPQRKGDSLPTVYLFTTLLPGEASAVLSKEETAVGLLMNTISHDYLMQAGTPEEVKETIRKNGQAFILKFTQMIEQDPYVLRAENFDNVYDQTYLNAALACKTALQNMMPQGAMLMQGMPVYGSSGSGETLADGQAGTWKTFSEKDLPQNTHSVRGISGTLIVKPNNSIDDFVIAEDTGNLGNANVGGKMTGSIQIENDSMLFAHFKVTDLVSGNVLQDLPVGFLNRAFGPNLLGPQGGWSTFYWASTALYKAEFQSIILEIHTPGLKGSTWSEYIDGPSLALGLRTMYSSAVIPVISLLLPVGEARAKMVFDFMKDYGLFEVPLDKWTAGDWGGGVWDFVKKIAEREVLTKVVEKYVEGIVEPTLIAGYVSKALVKFGSGAKSLDLIGTGVDLGKLATDVLATHSKIEFQVIFPVSINKLTPSTLTKMAKEDDNPVFKLAGTGLDSFTFEGVEYEPDIYLEAEDNDGDDIQHTIDAADLTVNDDGTALEFQVPFSWSQVGSNVSGAIYVNLIHHFVDYNGIDEVVRVTLPEKATEENFKIDLVSDLAITSLSKDKVSERDELILHGKGFAAFFGNNKVYFIDHQNNTIEGEVDYGDETYLKVIVPKNLEPGPLKVYVELDDKSKSNEKTLAMLPNMVTADPVDGTNFEGTLDVWLSQDQLLDIHYRVDDGQEIKTSGFTFITLDKTSNIHAYARATVNGVNYDSYAPRLFYYKCADDEKFIDGECVRDSSTDKLSFTVTVSVPSVERAQYHNSGDFTLHTFRAGPRFLAWSVSDDKWVEETGGPYASLTARVWIDPVTNEASGFIAGINSSQGGGIQFNRVPAMGTNKFAVYGPSACGHSVFVSPVPGYDDWFGTCVESVPASAGASIEVTFTGSLDAP